MTPFELAGILGTVPEHHLALLDLARALTGPDGLINLEAAAAGALEVREAQRQAGAYIASVSTLGKSLLSVPAVAEGQL